MVYVYPEKKKKEEKMPKRKLRKASFVLNKISGCLSYPLFPNIGGDG